MRWNHCAKNEISDDGTKDGRAGSTRPDRVGVFIEYLEEYGRKNNFDYSNKKHLTHFDEGSSIIKKWLLNELFKAIK